jgi:hypothetical protein
MKLKLQKKLQEIYERNGWQVSLYGEFINCIWEKDGVIWAELSDGWKGDLKDIDESQISVYREVASWQDVNLEA